jgi:hypothetical protein
VVNYSSLVAETGGEFAATSVSQRVAGWFTFTNIILVTASIIALGALLKLFGHYFVWLIEAIPEHGWHLLLWSGCGALVALSPRLDDMYLMMAIPGVLGFIGCTSLTVYLLGHNVKEVDNDVVGTIYSAILTVVWAISAIYLNDQLVGFMAVGALMSLLGFGMFVIPGIVCVGFNNDGAVNRATVAAGLILGLHILLLITGNTMQQLDVFRIGMVGLGSFVFYLGLLIMSSKWYSYKDRSYDIPKYLSINAITVVCGAIALMVGSTYHVNTLLGVGGTLFYLFLIEKYYEIPWKGVGWAWSALGLGGILYVFAVFARANPQYFFMA